MVCSLLQNYRGELQPHWPGGVFGWDISSHYYHTNLLSGKTIFLLHQHGNMSWEETGKGNRWVMGWWREVIVGCGVMERSHCRSWGNGRGFVMKRGCHKSWSGEGGIVIMFVVIRWWREVIVVVRGSHHCCHLLLWSNKGKGCGCEVTGGKMDHEMMRVSCCCRLYGPNSLGTMSRFVYDFLQQFHPSSLCSLFHWYPFLCHHDPLA